MAIKTNKFGISRAVDFFKKSIYFGIGKTSEWDNESNPPNPTFDASLEEPIGYRKADRVYLVVPHDGSTVPDGTTIIDYSGGTQWKVVNEIQAFVEGANYIYIETSILPTDFPTGEYRQVGVFTGLERSSGVDAGKFHLLPSEVDNEGVTEIIDYREKSIRNSNTKEFLSYIIKF
jgi:hypothetical protein